VIEMPEPDAPAPAVERPTDSLVRYYRPLLVLVFAQLVTGVVFGLIWLKWAPSTLSYFLSNGNGGSFVIPSEAESQIAGDGRFVVLSVIAGLLFGLLAWRVRGIRGPVTIGVLAVSSMLSSVLAMFTGKLLSGGSNPSAINTAFHPKLSLHASAALWVQALFAVLVYTALVGISADQTLGQGAPAEPAPAEALPV
jgi:hypothetical protein